jgi:hypothetical protein
MSEADEQPRITLYHRFDNNEGQFSTVRKPPKFHVVRHRC